MAVFQLMLDVHTSTECLMTQLPLEFSSVFGKEVYSIPLYEEEQESFSWLWESILLEMMMEFDDENPETIEQAYAWIKQNKLTQVSSFQLMEDGVKRHVLAFGDEAWNQDLMVSILFQEKEGGYEEVIRKDSYKCLYRMGKKKRILQETTYAICGNALERSLETPIPEAYFNELCEQKLFYEALPYLILFFIQAPILYIRSVTSAPHYMS